MKLKKAADFLLKEIIVDKDRIAVLRYDTSTDIYEVKLTNQGSWVEEETLTKILKCINNMKEDLS